MRITAAERIFARLHQGEAELPDLVDECFCGWSTANKVVTELHECGLVRIARWRRTAGGYPAKVWAVGQGDAPYPERKSRSVANSETRKRGIARWAEIVGLKTARRLYQSRKNNGVEKLIVNGKVIYERRKQTQRQDGPDESRQSAA